MDLDANASETNWQTYILHLIRNAVMITVTSMGYFSVHKEGVYTLNYNPFQCSTIHQIKLHVLPTTKFKTYAIALHIGQLLEEDNATSTALLPYVLQRGTIHHPETKQYREHLDGLYGTGFSVNLIKRGNYQIAQFRMDVIHEHYVSSGTSLLQEGLTFLFQTLFQPILENNHFRSAYVQSEKINMHKRIQSILNDKIRYASERLNEEMFKHTPLRLSPLGELHRLADLDEVSLYHHYQQWLERANIDLYLIGDTTLSEVEAIVDQAWITHRKASPGYFSKPDVQVQREPQTIIDHLDVRQGKLHLGFNFPITREHDQYPVALMFNGILGGYPHAKLFTQVREKASLAYYATSRYDPFAGIITIQSGIDISHYDQAVHLILEQVQALKREYIQPEELHMTRSMLVNHLREIQDHAFEMIEYDFHNLISNSHRTWDELITAIEQVTLADLHDIAQKVTLNTIYFLRDEE